MRASAWPGTSALEECFGKPTAMEIALCAEGRACGSGTATPARALLAGGRHSTKAPGAGRGRRPAGPAPAAHGSCPSGRGCTAEAPAGGNYRPAGKLWQCLEARGPWRHPPGSGKQGPLRAETPSWAQVPRYRAWSSPALEPVPARAATSGRRHPERVPAAALQPLGDTSWWLTLSTEINGKHLPLPVLRLSVCLLIKRALWSQPGQGEGSVLTPTGRELSCPCPGQGSSGELKFCRSQQKLWEELKYAASTDFPCGCIAISLTH